MLLYTLKPVGKCGHGTCISWPLQRSSFIRVTSLTIIAAKLVQLLRVVNTIQKCIVVTFRDMDGFFTE